MEKPAKPVGDEATAGHVPLVFEDRYERREVLKQSRTTQTFTGLDRETGERVVIKTVVGEHIPAGIQIRLELEADILRRIRHPLMAPLLSVGREDGVFYLVTPLQAGSDLHSVLRGGRLSLHDALTIGRCLLELLCETHRQGVFHRDIKPTNIIVDKVAPLSRAILVDFGLAHSTQLDVARGDQSVESVRYLAPEQAGLLDVEVGAYSDLFSLGCVLYECLTGRPPVDGRTVGEVLRNQLTVQPPKLRSFGLELPRALDEILQRMLRKDPRDRYQSAAAVLADVVALIEALKRGETEPSIVVGLHDQRTTLTEPAFVGREDEILRLDEQIQQTLRGAGGLVLLEAESGGGKTRLLSEWARRGVSDQIWVLRGQALDQIAQRPFQILKGVVDEIVAEANATLPLARSLRHRLGASAESVGAVLPELAGVFRLDPAQTLGPEAFAERRSIDALARLLWHLGSEERPAVVILDDCQWADGLSLRLLERWQMLRSDSGAAECWVTIVAAFRSEEVGPEHLLRALQPNLHLRLPPFHKDDLRSLVESMAGQLPGEALDVIESLAGGSPFMASAVLRGMVESKALLSEQGGWRIDRHAMDDVRSSRHAAELLTRRVELLPLVAVDLLKAAAVLGKEFDLELAASLAGLVPRHAMVGLRQAQARHLVWMRADQERCLFVHDKVRETLLDQLTDAERQDLQRRAAQLLEQVEPLPVFELAHLYDAAGDSQRALPYAVEAAEQARSQHSLEIAEQLYRIAVRGSLGAEEQTRFRIASGLGDVLMLRGDYDTAAQMFEAAKFIAADMPQGNFFRAQIEGKLGELAFKRGDMNTAAQALERGLAHLDCWTPAAGQSVLGRLLWEIFIQTLHSLVPSWFVGRRSLDHPQRERDLLAVRLYFRIGHAYWFTRGKIPTLWIAVLAMNVAERYPPTLELADTYSGHAPVMSLIPWFRRAEEYALRSLRIRRNAGDAWAQAQSLHYYGIVLYAASRFEECIEKCREAVRLFQRTGDYWEMNMARYQLAASLYRQGDLARAVREAQAIHESGIELKDAQAAGISLDIWAWASGGMLPAEIVKVELERERNDFQATAQVLVAEGVRLIGAGWFGEAVEVLERAWQVVNASGVRNAWVAPVLPWLATAIRLQTDSLKNCTPRQRNMLLRRRERVVRKALEVTRKFQNDLPHAMRENALFLANLGKIPSARRAFDKSLEVARRQGAEFEYAQSLRQRGLVGAEVGWPRADDDLAQGSRQIARLKKGLPAEDKEVDSASSDSVHRLATLSLVDRFDTVLDAGRKIASALRREAIFEAVRDAGLRLLRGEHCEMLTLGPDLASPEETSGVLPPSASLQAGDAMTVEVAEDLIGGRDIVARQGSLSCRLIKDALRAKQAVTFASDTEDRDEASGELEGTRSAICSPIYVRHRPEVCLYSTHSQIAGLFSEDERRLADFIAAIAGAALENADGFEALQKLNATLEQRVAERTADLELRTNELARSNADLEQFAYVASHDLREPLRTVSSYCQMIQSRLGEQLDEEVSCYLRNAIDAAGRMRTLINDLLTYSRVGTRGKAFERTDCSEVVEVAIANLLVVIEETSALVTYDPLPTVRGDATQLVRLFQNLIDNAIKFRSQRRPQVHISATRRGGEWLFSVDDNGIGIARNEHKRIFMIFQRLHGQDEYAGTGIGLAVCKKTVERHGGTIWVESEPGKGSSFRFTLQPCDPEQ